MGDNLARLLAAMYHAQDDLRQTLTENNGDAYDNSSNTKQNFFLSEANQFILSNLAPCLVNHEPITEEIQAWLTFADEAGLDWEELYRVAVEDAKEVSKRTCFPPISEVSPNSRQIDSEELAEEREGRRPFIEFLKGARDRQIR